MDVFNESQSKKKRKQQTSKKSKRHRFLLVLWSQCSQWHFLKKNQGSLTGHLGHHLFTYCQKTKLSDGGALLICSQLRQRRVLIAPLMSPSVYCVLTAVWVDTFDPNKPKPTDSWWARKTTQTAPDKPIDWPLLSIKQMHCSKAKETSSTVRFQQCAKTLSSAVAAAATTTTRAPPQPQVQKQRKTYLNSEKMRMQEKQNTDIPMASTQQSNILLCLNPLTNQHFLHYSYLK